jgi:hypothetical protein
MSDEFSLVAPQLALTFIITGGIVAGTYEWIRYYFNKKREDSFEISKQKIGIIKETFVHAV